MIVLILFMLDSLFGVTDINNVKYAKQMGKELMPVVGNPSKWWDKCMPKDKKRDWKVAEWWEWCINVGSFGKYKYLVHF